MQIGDDRREARNQGAALTYRASMYGCMRGIGVVQMMCEPQRTQLKERAAAISRKYDELFCGRPGRQDGKCNPAELSGPLPNPCAAMIITGAPGPG